MVPETVFHHNPPVSPALRLHDVKQLVESVLEGYDLLKVGIALGYLGMDMEMMMMVEMMMDLIEMMTMKT